MRLLVALFLVLPLAGCGLGTACSENLLSGVGVTVLDSAGERVCSARVVAKGDGYEETLEPFPSESDPACSYAGLWEKPGTFTISATSDRFDGVLERSVTIAADECHVIPEAVELRAP